ncbi:hypothetical protein AKJ16_DCAP25775 [Drosera capensis]
MPVVATHDSTVFSLTNVAGLIWDWIGRKWVGLRLWLFSGWLVLCLNCGYFRAGLEFRNGRLEKYVL